MAHTIVLNKPMSQRRIHDHEWRKWGSLWEVKVIQLVSKKFLQLYYENSLSTATWQNNLVHVVWLIHSCCPYMFWKLCSTNNTILLNIHL